MKKGLISGFKVARKAKFTVEVYSPTTMCDEIILKCLFVTICQLTGFHVLKLLFRKTVGWLLGYKGGTSFHWCFTDLNPETPPSVPRLASTLSFLLATSTHGFIWCAVRFNNNSPQHSHKFCVDKYLSWFMITDRSADCGSSSSRPMRAWMRSLKCLLQFPSVDIVLSKQWWCRSVVIPSTKFAALLPLFSKSTSSHQSHPGHTCL